MQSDNCRVRYADRGFDRQISRVWSLPCGRAKPATTVRTADPTRLCKPPVDPVGEPILRDDPAAARLPGA